MIDTAPQKILLILSLSALSFLCVGDETENQLNALSRKGKQTTGKTSATKTAPTKSAPAKPSSDADDLIDDSILIGDDDPDAKATGALTDDAGKKKRSAPTIADLTPEILEKSHAEQYKNRPKPDDFDFEKSQEVSDYLARCADVLTRKRERRRLDFVENVRGQIIRTCDRNPYSGPIFQKNSKSTGTIAMCNENGVVIKKGKAKKGKEVAWKTLSHLQPAKMLETFGDQRIKIKMAGKSQEEIRKEAADDYFAAAVFLDWYGEYEESLRVLNKALKANPEVNRLAEMLFLD